MLCLIFAACCIIGGCDGCGCGWGCGWGYSPGYYGCGYPVWYADYPAPPAYWGGYGYPDGYANSGYGAYPYTNYAAPQTPPAPAAAEVVVKLPEDARFFIGDRAYSLDKTHSFETPKLQVGQTYEYTLKIEVKRAGQTLTQSKRVTVLAGQKTVVEFDNFTTVASH